MSTDAVRDMIAKKIAAALTDSELDKLIDKGIASLKAPREGSYGRSGPSALEGMISGQVSRVGSEVAQELVDKHPEVRAKVHRIAEAALQRLVATEEKALVDKLYGAMMNILRIEGYDE